jgi:hypothetical protein
MKLNGVMIDMRIAMIGWEYPAVYMVCNIHIDFSYSQSADKFRNMKSCYKN